MNLLNRGLLLGLLSFSALVGCGGGSSTPAADTLSGTAAVGSPIVGGTIQVTCAGGSALASTTTSTGAWQVTLSGQTLPCAVQVSGGTINSFANATAYHSIAISAGTVNVTPLTDLLVANVAGATAPGTWFSGLTPSKLAAINQTGVNAALTQLRTALPSLTPLGTLNPITTAFTPTPGNNVDDMLAALQTATTNAGSSYATLLSNASQSTFTAPSGYSTALSNAYAGTTSGGASAIPAVPGGVSATTASSTQINVNWTSVSGASSYNVYRSNSPTVQTVVGNKINTPVVTAGPFQNTGLSASTTYYFKVTAVNAAGETLGSTEVSATTSAPGVITPTIASFSPSTGTVGASVTLTGTNFSTTASSNTVNFNGVQATVTNATATQLTVTVPSTASTGNITVAVGGQTATSATAFTVSGTVGGGGTVVHQTTPITLSAKGSAGAADIAALVGTYQGTLGRIFATGQATVETTSCTITVAADGMMTVAAGNRSYGAAMSGDVGDLIMHVLNTDIVQASDTANDRYTELRTVRGFLAAGVARQGGTGFTTATDRVECLLQNPVATMAGTTTTAMLQGATATDMASSFVGNYTGTGCALTVSNGGVFRFTGGAVDVTTTLGGDVTDVITTAPTIGVITVMAQDYFAEGVQTYIELNYNAGDTSLQIAPSYSVRVNRDQPRPVLPLGSCTLTKQ